MTNQFNTNQSTRFFSFGCSFTSYCWPTWANILGRNFDCFENWGRAGAGNEFIFHSLIECLRTKKINNNDLIIIMWSHPARRDTYYNRKWVLKGSDPDHDALIEHNDLRGDLLRSLSLMYAAKELLIKSECQWYFTSMMELSNQGFYCNYYDNNLNDVYLQYNDVLKIMRPSMHKTIFNENWASRLTCTKEELESLRDHYTSCAGPNWPNFENVVLKNFDQIDIDIMQEITDKKQWNWEIMIRKVLRTDIHPTPLEHLEFLKLVFPELSISPQTVDYVKNINPWALKKIIKNNYQISTEMFDPSLHRAGLETEGQF